MYAPPKGETLSLQPVISFDPLPPGRNLVGDNHDPHLGNSASILNNVNVMPPFYQSGMSERMTGPSISDPMMS